MREAIRQSLQNLRANKLRSVLTMFGILWGIVSIVVLSAMGEGFRRGNDQVLREFGRNIGIVWGRRTSLQAGGERAGRVIRLTFDDARAVERQSRLIERLSPEINRSGVHVKSRVQRRVGHRPRDRAAVPGHPHARTAGRPSAQLARRIRIEASRHRRLGDGEAAVRRSSSDRRGGHHRRRHASRSSAGCGARIRTAATTVPTTTRSSFRSR